MTDPWDDFVARASGSEVAGYFERGSDRARGSGVAVSFVSAEDVRTLVPSTDITEFARASDRFLKGGRRRAIVGYAGFDSVGLFEPALRSFPSGPPFPLGEFAEVSATDVHPVRARRVVTSSRSAPGRPKEDSLRKGAFERSVRRLHQDIRDGEAYQVVLSHRRAWPRPCDLLERAGRLRASERYAFFFYLRFGDRELVGATPESVVEVDGRRAYVNPIAGTIWPGPEAEGRLPLEVDPKELAEHRMLVDLARNDLGGVARPGSVRLLSKERRVRYARLDHLVSRVTGELRSGVGAWQAFGAAFPAGTVSGAPKIRAIELLRREEATWRGPYAGAVGLLQPGGRADWALAIRTAFASGDRLYTAAGAGIVYHSEPSREFHETLAKLSHIEAELVGEAR
ncbi:MAG: anthranilate synthase component I family protein [Thermoplasmata archaeon]|jgi:anthranilate synthase component 1